jgi:hypothetical protein
MTTLLYCVFLGMGAGDGSAAPAAATRFYRIRVGQDRRLHIVHTS